jgi:2-keto-3-deoxy-L-rhamnonate aldolase RhmA
MRTSNFKAKVRAGHVPVGHMIMEFTGRSIPTLLENAGADFVIIDLEHSPTSIERLADLLVWFRATTVEPFVRIPQVDYHWIARILDAGAAGIMAPDIKSADEAQKLVSAAKYAPAGRRGVFLGGGLTHHRAVDPVEFKHQSNENTVIICQIESRTGVSNAAAIAAVPGVDVLWIGHGDLSHDLGVPNQFGHPDFLHAFTSVHHVARAQQKALGIQPRGPAQAEAFLKLGANVLSFAADTFVYQDALQAGITRLRELANS